MFFIDTLEWCKNRQAQNLKAEALTFKPVKVPRKIARPPSSTLGPIYENQRSVESQMVNTD